MSCIPYTITVNELTCKIYLIHIWDFIWLTT